jgi:hypothetical protein
MLLGPVGMTRRCYRAFTQSLASCSLFRAAHSRRSGGAAATARTVRQVTRRWPPAFRSSTASSYAAGVLSPLISLSKSLSWEDRSTALQHTGSVFLWLSVGLDRVNTDAVGASLTGTQSWPVVAMASHVHCRVVIPCDIQPQDELLRYIGDENPNIQSALPLSQLSQREATWKTNCPPGLLSGFPTTMSGLASVSNAPASIVTRHDLSCIQPSATSLSSVLLVQEPALNLLPPDTGQLYSSQAGLQRRSYWPAHMSFRSWLKCLIINCSVFLDHESHFWHQFVTYLRVLFTMELYCTPKFNTQPLITISSIPNTTGATSLFRSQNTTGSSSIEAWLDNKKRYYGN